MKIATLTLVVVLQASLSLAVSFPTSISRDALKVDTPSERLSVGVSYEEIERGVDIDGGYRDVLLKANAASLYIGYDIHPWFTFFGTVGGVELDDETGDIESDAGLKISAGISTYLWQVDIVEPTFMEGRFSFRPTAEITRYTTDSNMGDATWIDAMVTFPLGYEFFDRFPTSTKGINTSLALYVGPALSYMSGSVDSFEGNVDFDASEALGIVGGADVYLSPQVSLGVVFSIFDETTVSGSLRFHL